MVALGDRTAGDDGAGPALIESLRGKTDLELLDAGSCPQNYIGVIARQNPETVVFVDGAELGLSPGQIRILESGDVTDIGAGSHGFPLTLLMTQTAFMAQADVSLLGIQVAHLKRGGSLSQPVANAVSEITDFICAMRPESTPPPKS